MAKKSSGNDMFRTQGFKTPMAKGSAKGDAFQASPVPARGGPVRDPLGITPASGGRKGLPVGR